ncbi:MAG: winged helix-turn-helix transcriptional regulator [Tabrizicola sp.]|nr:winged helix-turn-helix transcriptional regulator [Tabrizicola sp.]
MAFIGGGKTSKLTRYLSTGPCQISEVRVDISLVSAKVLTQRLRELEERGILIPNVREMSSLSVEHALT